MLVTLLWDLKLFTSTIQENIINFFKADSLMRAILIYLLSAMVRTKISWMHR